MPWTCSPSQAVTTATVTARLPSRCFRSSGATGTGRWFRSSPSGGWLLVRLDLVDAVLRVELLVGEDHVDLAGEAALRIALVLHPVDVDRLALRDVGDLALLAVDGDRGAAQHRTAGIDLEGRVAALLDLEIHRRLRTLAFLGDLHGDGVGGRVELDPLALALRALGLGVGGQRGGRREQERDRGQREGAGSGEDRHRESSTLVRSASGGGCAPPGADGNPEATRSSTLSTRRDSIRRRPAP